MNRMVYLILGIIALFIIAKNWDKIAPYLNKKQKSNNNERVQPNLERIRKEQLESIDREIKRIEEEISRMTYRKREEIKQLKIQRDLIR